MHAVDPKLYPKVFSTDRSEFIREGDYRESKKIIEGSRERKRDL
jgi:hypothetical protein